MAEHDFPGVHLFLFAVMGTVGLKPGATTTHSWVDSPTSQVAGNEMWGIRKGPAEFTFDHDPARSS
ncbi:MULTISPECIES: acetoacetate decarboxylase family protein [Lentzea]|uniref:hypothetical protein n=1 Tax=Lentzea TaxID=165301 RepID=UPI0011B43CCB|nr:hypothetical protein [Lentzea atacamensis]